jgi:hypothetical protein
MRLVLIGAPYAEPRYYGSVEWAADGRGVYLRQPSGAKTSRHGDGATYLTSTDASRRLETRVPTSDITHERVNFITLPSSMPEPPVLSGEIRSTDLVLHTSSIGTSPQLAVEIAANRFLPEVLAAWQAQSTVGSICTCVDKQLDQTLIVALAPSSTGAG